MKSKKMKYWSFFLKYFIAPIVSGLIVWLITSKKINEIEERIKIQDSIIQSNKTEIQNQNKLINDYKIEIKSYKQNNKEGDNEMNFGK